MADVTCIILTKNEAVNLPDCLKSLAGFARRVVVVDSGSTDDTCRIARTMGAQVYVHPFETHARQWNWAFDNVGVDTKWTLKLDADERLTPKLIQALEGLMRDHDGDDVNGVTLEAWLYFMGRRIAHGCHNKRKLIFFKTGLARVEDRRIDEHTLLTKGRAIYCKERFLHYDYKDMTHWINKMNWYATREAADYFDFLEGRSTRLGEGEDAAIAATRKKKFGLYYRFPMFLRCWLLFIYNYIFRLGFLDGREGFLYNYLYHRWYRTLVDAKILERRKTNRPFEAAGDLKEG